MSDPRASNDLRRRWNGALARVMLADAHPLSKRIARWLAKPSDSERDAIDKAIERSAARAAARRESLPVPRFPEELPVSALRERIAEVIAAHQVVIVSGETGSGKTTQLPKICLGMERGVRGMIGHTQPRRIAARTVALRIAQELGTKLGDIVGYQVRFTGEVSDRNLIKLMTDGILLAETQGDRFLNAYDTLIIDEAHERSLNIDFLLGYLKQLLPKRRDLKLIITSATLDAERFAAHFAHGDKPAPVVEVSGRLYPVEIRYRPLKREEDDDEAELEDAIVDAVDECARHGPGDVLVFLPGEREIRETSDLLRRHAATRRQPIEILPLFARLSVAEQQRVFEPGSVRRVVLATNVAETSLTVPGIRFVIDSGLARINRYSVKNKVQLLQIEKISQAAANQRAGRCGRVAAGVCIRLYSDEDFAARPQYTDPEILRSSLASVILRMASLKIGAVDEFPFLERPAPRAIADGYQLLQELGAVDARRALTPLGRDLARLPLDPRISRMILAGRDEGMLPEVLIIASALSVPDPRERPLERQGAADQAHIRFKDERSDFLAYLHLWDFFDDALKAGMSHRKLVDHCRANFVSTLRMREWRDTHNQVRELLREAGWSVPDYQRVTPKAEGSASRADRAVRAAADARYERIHRALLTGLLGNIGTKSDDDDSYSGARGLRFLLHPGSGINREGARWVMVSELAETTRLYGRVVARIEPEWIERVAGGLVERVYFDPQWDKARGEVIASERVTLYGLTLVPRRKVSYGPIDPAASREVFVREALTAGELGISAPFVEHNRRLLAEIEELEHKARRQDVLVEPEDIVAFFAGIVPPGIHDRATFERWRAAEEAKSPRTLFLTREALMRHRAKDITEEQFPKTLDVAGNALALRYRFEPGHAEDGITLAVPLALLNQVDPARIDWLVPGMIREKLNWYLKSLPKTLRNRETPLAPVVTDFLVEAGDTSQPVAAALRTFLGRRWSMVIPATVWDGAEPPAHLRMNLRVVDAAGNELGASRDLAALKKQFGEAAQLTFAGSDPGIEKTGMKAWDCGDLPEALTFVRGGRRLTGFPALSDDGESVSVRLFDTDAAARASHRGGVLRLLRIALREQVKQLDRGWPGFNAVALQLRGRIAPERLLADWIDAICERAFLGDDPLPRSSAQFDAQKQRARARLAAVRSGAERLLADIANEHAQVTQAVAALPPALHALRTAIEARRDGLVFPGFMRALGWEHLADVPRYLKALQRRLQKYRENPERDARHAAAIESWRQRWHDARARAARDETPDAALEDFRWWIEELAVALFAQELKTPFPVSGKRLERRWSELTGA
jgi:ATP-dependent helicase HrpA